MSTQPVPGMVRLSSGLLLATAVGGLALLAFQIAVLMAVVDIGVPPLSEEMIKNKVTPEEAYHTSLTLEWLRVAGTFLIVAAGPLLAWLTWRGRQLARKLTFWFAAFVFVLGAIMMISTRDDTQNLLDSWAQYHLQVNGLTLADVDNVDGRRSGFHCSGVLVASFQTPCRSGSPHGV